MSSISENKAMRFSKEQASSFAGYTSGHLCRIYPKGSRVDSSNLEPLPMWAVGCQLVALNFQTPDRPMHLNQGFFALNGGCGYVVKPEYLITDKAKPEGCGCQPTENGTRLVIKLISGCQIPYQREDKVKSDRNLNVQVRVAGVEAERRKDRSRTVWNRREDKSRTVKNNGYNPVWNDTFDIPLQSPHLALLTLTVRDGDAFLAHNTIPVSALQKGYRQVPLLSKECEPLPFGSLFIHCQVADET